MIEEQKPKPKRINQIFINFLVGSCIVSVAAVFYLFYYKKDYHFVIETECSKDSETCFFRDCEAEDSECPPNNLSYYKTYDIRANDFGACENEDCTAVCKTGAIACEQVICTEEDIADGMCTVPEPSEPALEQSINESAI